MAKKNKAADHSAILNTIVNDTKGVRGYSLVNPDDVKALVDAGHIEINHSIIDPSGKIAARATATLLTAHAANGPAPEATATDATPAIEYTLELDIPLPVAARGGRRGEQYPFSKMELNSSFFVPVTTKYPKPWETFASTVSSATRRFSTEHPIEKRKDRKGNMVAVLVATRKFTLRQVAKGQKYSNGFEEKADGARVFRIQ